MQYAFVIAATGVSGAMLYQVVSEQSSIKSLKAKFGTGGAEIDIQFTKPKPTENQVKGTIKVPKNLLLGDLRSEFENDLNDVDGSKHGIDGKPIRITSWAPKLRAPNVDHFECTIQNKTSNYMYAQMFQGFESSSEKAKAVAWAVSSTTIGNGDKATDKWNIQFVMVAGQITDDFSASIEPILCDLGDQADVTMVDNHISVTKSATKGPSADSITFNIKPGFPANEFYVGFGILDPATGDAKASGVAPAQSSMSLVFKPYLRYSVNLTSEVSTNLYDLSSISDFWPVEYKSSFRYALCVFDDNGWQPVKYSVTPSALVEKLADDVEKVEITTKRQVKRVVLEYV